MEKYPLKSDASFDIFFFLLLEAAIHISPVLG
jgi:hypothetical protein